MFSLTEANEQYRAVSYKRCIDLLKKREKITDVVQVSVEPIDYVGDPIYYGTLCVYLL